MKNKEKQPFIINEILAFGIIILILIKFVIYVSLFLLDLMKF